LPRSDRPIVWFRDVRQRVTLEIVPERVFESLD
jgi:hypothetical protein